MRCRKVKDKLARYLGGECRFSESNAIKKHLSGCPQCAAELLEFRRLDYLLDQWQAEPAPPELWDAVMAQVVQEVPGNKHFMPQVRRSPWLLLRDLAVAAAVSLLLCWNVGSWLNGGQLLAAGKSVNGAVVSYTRITDNAVTRITETAGNYTQKLFFE